MSKNHLRGNQSLPSALVTKTVLGVGAFVIFLSIYMYYQAQNFHLAEENLKYGELLAKLETQNRQLEVDLERMQTQSELRRRLARINSDLTDVNRLEQIPMDQSTRAHLVHSGLTSTVASSHDLP